MFTILVSTLLPDSWDLFTRLYFGNKGKATVTSQELIGLVVNEAKRLTMKEKDADIANETRIFNNNKQTPGSNPNMNSMSLGCHNCRRFRHVKDQCYAQGGGKEGQWPRDQGPRQHWRGGRRNETANQANNDDAPLGDVAWQTGMPSFDPLFFKNDWIADTGTLSHIATQQNMFSTFNLESSHIGGFGEDMGLESMGRGVTNRAQPPRTDIPHFCARTFPTRMDLFETVIECTATDH